MFDLKQVKDNLLYPSEIAKFRRANIHLSDDNPLIVIWEFGGFPAILRKNAIHSLALNLRGYRTKVILCDGVSRACILRTDSSPWSSCVDCVSKMTKETKTYGLDTAKASQYISPQAVTHYQQFVKDFDLRKIINFRLNNIPHGSIAWNSFNRFKKGRLLNAQTLTETDQQILRMYLTATLVNYHVAQEVLKIHRPVAALTSHGVYSDYAPILYAAKVGGIHSTSWTSGFSPYHLYYSTTNQLEGSDLRGISKSEWSKIKRQKLTIKQRKLLSEFISDRYINQKALDVNFANQDYKLRKSSKYTKTVCIFAHINWDVALDNEPMLFQTANEWLIKTLKIAIKSPSIRWLIKLHPGENDDGHAYTTEQLLKDNFHHLPPNIQIIQETDQVNPLSLYKSIDVGVTLFGTVGIELAIFGKPTINASSAHYAGKGFTHDANTQKEYFNLLKSIPQLQPLTASQILLAKKYAHSYFISRQVSHHVIERGGHWGSISINALDDLKPGKNVFIDKICEGIIQGLPIRQ